MTIRTMALDAMVQEQIDRELTKLEYDGKTVISVSITKKWDGWFGKKQAMRMDAIVTYRMGRGQ